MLDTFEPFILTIQSSVHASKHLFRTCHDSFDLLEIKLHLRKIIVNALQKLVHQLVSNCRKFTIRHNLR